MSLGPLLAIYGILVGSLFSGSFAVELVASWPGLADLMRQALVARDTYLVAGCAAAGAVFLAAAVLAADVDARGSRSASGDRIGTMSLGQRMGVFGAAVLIAATALASFIAPYDPGRQFSDRPFAPPTLPHVVDDDGHVRAPFVYPMHLVDPLERRYEADHRQPMTLHWFRGRLVERWWSPIRGSCSAATVWAATCSRG